MIKMSVNLLCGLLVLSVITQQDIQAEDSPTQELVEHFSNNKEALVTELDKQIKGQRGLFDFRDNNVGPCYGFSIHNAATGALFERVYFGHLSEEYDRNDERLCDSEGYASKKYGNHVSFVPLLKRLNPEQLILLCFASEQWKKGTPFKVDERQDPARVAHISTLPRTLQHAKLFRVNRITLLERMLFPKSA